MSSPESTPPPNNPDFDPNEIVDAVLVDEHGNEIPNEPPDAADGPSFGALPYDSEEARQSRANHEYNTSDRGRTDTDSEGWRRAGYYEGAADAADRARQRAEAAADDAARTTRAAERRAQEDRDRADATEQARAATADALAEAERLTAQARVDAANATADTAEAARLRLQAEQELVAAQQRAAAAEQALQDKHDADQAAIDAEQRRVAAEQAARDREMRERATTPEQQTAAAELAEIARRVSINRGINTTQLRNNLGIAPEPGASPYDPTERAARDYAWATVKELVRQGVLTTGQPDMDRNLLSEDANSATAARHATLAGTLQVVPMRANGMTPGDKHAQRLAQIQGRRPGDEYLAASGAIRREKAARPPEDRDKYFKLIALDRYTPPAPKAEILQHPDVVDVAHDIDGKAQQELTKLIPGSRVSLPRLMGRLTNREGRLSSDAADQIQKKWEENTHKFMRDDMAIAAKAVRRRYAEEDEDRRRAGEDPIVRPVEDNYELYARYVVDQVNHLSATAGKKNVHARSGNMERSDTVRQAMAGAFREIERRNNSRRRP